MCCARDEVLELLIEEFGLTPPRTGNSSSLSVVKDGAAGRSALVRDAPQDADEVLRPSVRTKSSHATRSRRIHPASCAVIEAGIRSRRGRFGGLRYAERFEQTLPEQGLARLVEGHELGHCLGHEHEVVFSDVRLSLRLVDVGRHEPLVW